MARKTVLIAGASGLVGYAAVRHFAAEPDCEVIAVSRRRPDDVGAARFVAVDLTDPRACAELIGSLPQITHVVYAALHEKPGLVSGWRDADQITTNDRMLRNIIDPLDAIAKGLRHVALLQGTKAYGIHVRAMPVPAREGRSDLRSEPNFYWLQEDYLRDRQRGKPWTFTIFRPVLIIGYSQGSAMNLIPAIGVYGAFMKDAGQPLHFPGGQRRVQQAVDADPMARAIAWAGETPAARNETYNVANGDVFCWHDLWQALADVLGLKMGEMRPMGLQRDIAPRETDWARIRATHNLVSPDLKAFVGLSFQYADYHFGTGRADPIPPAYSSTIEIMQAGFTEVMDTEAMFVKWLKEFQEIRLLPPA